MIKTWMQQHNNPNFSILSGSTNEQEDYDGPISLTWVLSSEVNNPMFQIVIPGAGPVLSPGASNEQTW